MYSQMHVLNGEKYKELCPDNTLLSISQIKTCVISHQTKALLRREGQPEDQIAVYLPLDVSACTIRAGHCVGPPHVTHLGALPSSSSPVPAGVSCF